MSLVCGVCETIQKRNVLYEKTHKCEQCGSKFMTNDLCYFVQNRAIVQTSKANLSQSGCNMENQASPC